MQNRKLKVILTIALYFPALLFALQVAYFIYDFSPVDYDRSGNLKLNWLQAELAKLKSLKHYLHFLTIISGCIMPFTLAVWGFAAYYKSKNQQLAGISKIHYQVSKGFVAAWFVLMYLVQFHTRH